MPEIDTSTQLFSQAAVLMLVGMGFVFAFLSLLIFVIKFIITPLATRFPDPVPQVKNTNKSLESGNKSAIVAAISVAIHQYRQKHK